MYDVIACGSATVDVFAKTQENELIKIMKPDSVESLMAYPSGSKILIDELEESIGGGGTNTAVAFARMGLKTGYIGCLGEDEQADAVLSLLQKEHIDFLGHYAKKKTGYSIILESLDGDRTILTYKGANNYLVSKKTRPFNAKCLYFSSLVGDSEKSQFELMKKGKKQGSLIAFNPSLYQVKKGLIHIKHLLELVDILIFNKEEASALTNHLDSKESAKILSKYVGLVVITDGSDTLVCCDRHYIYSFTPPKTKVVEATGAGDAFASGFVSSYLMNHSVEKALRVGLTNSQSVLRSYGAKSKLLTDKQVSKQLLKINIKREKI